MSGIMSMVLGARTAIAAAVDEFFNRVTLLLPGDGTNGAQNNTFLDSSSNTFSITRNGNTTQGTFSPFSQTGWSNYFNTATSDYLSVATNTAFSMGTGNFTAEFWFYSLDQSTSYPGILSANTYNGTGAISIRYDNTGTSNTKKIFVYLYGATAADPHLLSSSTYEFNQWIHVAVVRDSSTTTKLYVNGILQATGTVTAAQVVDFGVGGLNIGRGFSVDTTNAYFLGNISSLRIIKGQALTTGDFTPPTVPVTTSSVGWTGANVASSITGTVSLLTCQSNRFLDNSTANSGSPFSFTVNGTPSIQAFSPFAPTAAYSAATVGGSGYFDGTGDYLNLTDSSNVLDLGGATASIEFWLYPTASTTSFALFNKSGGTADYNTTNGIEYTIGFNSAQFLMYYNTSAAYGTLTDSTTRALNQWYHVVIASNSTTLALFVNGVRTATATATIVKPTTRTTFRVCRDLGTSYATGYLSGVRFIQGSGAYDAGQTNITVPTSPPTAVTNTSLLINFTNAGITDATAKNVLETVGNAQISTTQSKFGGSSMSFDGTTNTRLVPATNNLGAFGTGDFVIEFWVRFNAVNAAQVILDFRSATSSVAPAISLKNTGVIYYYTGGASPGERITGSTLSANTWYYVAVARASGTTRMYVDGSQVGANYTDSNNYVGIAGRPWIGNLADGSTPAQNLNAYIDDLRITIGNARGYTGSTITVPTAAFALQ